MERGEPKEEWEGWRERPNRQGGTGLEEKDGAGREGACGGGVL